MKISPCVGVLVLFGLTSFSAGLAQTPSGNGLSPAMESALPDAPQAQPAAPQPEDQNAGGGFHFVPPARKYAEVIEPGQVAQPLSSANKVVLSFREATNPLTLLPAIYSASYEQITRDDPRYGNDGDAYAARFGAAMLHSVSTRVLGDGIFASVFHQDPRYYRIEDGSILSRSLRAAEQALVGRGDGGGREINFSGLTARAASAALVLTYYPPPSRRTSVVVETFGISIASDAGANLVLEFLPDLARRYPWLKKLQNRVE